MRRVEGISRAEYTRPRSSGYAGPKKDLEPETRERWAQHEPYTHWVMRRSRYGVTLRPATVDDTGGGPR